MMRKHHGAAVSACFVYGLRPNHAGDGSVYPTKAAVGVHDGASHLYPPPAEICMAGSALETRSLWQTPDLSGVKVTCGNRGSESRYYGMMLFTGHFVH